MPSGAREAGEIEESLLQRRCPVFQLVKLRFCSLVRCGPNPLTLEIPLLLWRPNQKPQTWFHELTHGTGRHRDDRP